MLFADDIHGFAAGYGDFTISMQFRKGVQFYSCWVTDSLINQTLHSFEELLIRLPLRAWHILVENGP